MTAPTPRRARLGRYAGWQLRDYLLEKGIGTLVVLVLTGVINHITREVERAGGASPGTLQQLVVAHFAQSLGTLVLVGAIFATNGIVSDDRKHGYFRFLFAKPVAVPRFYAWKFAAHLAGFLLVALTAIALHWIVVHPIWTREIPMVVALGFVALGGIGFLLSAVWRVDWLSLVVVYIASTFLWRIYGDTEGWQRVPVRLLPPLHRLDGAYVAATAGAPLPWGDLLWIAGYGLVCFVLGLVVTRRRPLATP